jgi:ABC-type antimicrobial peptide transport system permease subunit
MRLGDIFTESFRAISANKARSGLTVLGIVIGIASVIALVAVGQGSTNSITSSIESTGANLVTVSPGFSRTAGPVSGGRGSATTLTVDDATAIADGVSQIAAIAPEVDGRYQIIASSANTNTQVIGTVSSYTEVHKITMAEGSFVSDVQNENASRVVVLGSTAATDLFGDPTSGGTDPVGQTLRIKGLQFTVIGVATSKGGTGFNSPDDAIYVPLTTSQRFLAGQTKYLSSIGVEAATQGAMTQVQTDITDLLLTRHKITGSASADFSVINQADLASTLSSTSKTLTLLLAAVAGISLIVGGIGIMNMMLTTVTERTREIGLRKAIGAKRRDVSIQFLVEAVVLTFFGGFLGIVLGWLISIALTRFAGLQSQVTPIAVVLAFGVSAVIGIVFGFYPARRAAGLNPIEALRYE